MNNRIAPLPHQWDHTPSHEDVSHVMETLVLPVVPYRYHVGQYVFVHEHVVETNPLAARECLITDVSGAPLSITVSPCNHPEEAFEVPQDKLSAPIEV